MSCLVFLGIIVFILFCIFYYIVQIPRYCHTKVCLLGKTAIVTGGSSGIGYAIVLELASRGCRVIVASRSVNEKLKNKIIEITHNPNIETKKLNLCSFKSIREFAKDINETEERLDILVNNAGMGISGMKTYTEDGLHEVMQTNHFGPFLLTHLLVDKMKKSAPSRIVFVSSLLGIWSNLSLENLNYPLKENMTGRENLKIYGNSKVCNIMTSNVLAEKLKKYNINCNAVHPGYVESNIHETSFINVGYKSYWAKLIHTTLNWITLNPPHAGAQSTLKAAVSNSFANRTGELINDKGWVPSPPKCYSRQLTDSVWKASIEYVKLKPNEILD